MKALRLATASLSLTLCVGCDQGEGGGDTGASQTQPEDRSLRVETWNTALLSFTVSSEIPPPGFLPYLTIDWFEEDFDMSYADRANAIADAILRGDQDVVALNEVFSDEARQILVDRLRGEYPYIVGHIAAVPPTQITDLTGLIQSLPLPDLPANAYRLEPLGSGLMLFSRYEFLPMADPRNDADCIQDFCDYWGENGDPSTPLGDSHLAFATYEEAHDFDQYASKGVGLVKLNAPGPAVYVAFTHTQADVDFPEEFAEDRASQYAQIEELLLDTIGEQKLEGNRVVLVGDLNTPGGSAEWLDTYWPGADPPFFSCGNTGPCSSPAFLTDAWGFETSVNDRGATHRSGNRLDYVVHNSADGTMCMQHAMIAYEQTVDGAEFHSDHRPVRADFNESALWCSPNINAWNADNRPHDLNFGELSCDNDVNTPAPACDPDRIVFPDDGATLVHPGSFQWFRVTQPGSYVFTTIDADADVDVEFRIYESTDLSRPIAHVDDDVAFTVEEIELSGSQYSFDSPPYFIRTFATRNGEPDRTVGDVPYALVAHQNLCRSPADACVMEPNTALEYPWPDQSMSTVSVSDIWYKFRTSGVLAGRPHPGESSPFDDLRFPQESVILEAPLADWGCLHSPTIEEYSTDNMFNLVQTRAWADIEGANGVDDLDDDGDPDGRYLASELPGDTLDELKFYYVHAARTCGTGFASTLEQQTTLTYFQPRLMTGKKQSDDEAFSDDELRFHFAFDPFIPGPFPSCDVLALPCHHTHDFYTPEDTHLDGVPGLQGYYADSFYPNIHEDEDTGDDDPIRPLRYSQNGEEFDWWEGGLLPLAPELAVATGNIAFRDVFSTADADYWYEIEYEQRRRKHVKLAP